jgi:HEPN domain-containing protein
MKRITEVWLSYALEDFIMAQKALEMEIYRQTCFHAQQAVEKGLKAFLLEKDIKIRKIHNLLELSSEFEARGIHLPVELSEMDFLNRVYRFRYPPDIGLLPQGQPTQEDAQKALRIARKVTDWIQQTLTESR